MAKKKDTNTILVPNKPEISELVNNDAQMIHIEPLIRIVRDQQVLLDSDLAMLYGVETKRLNEQVKRNIDRFPADFMFQLTAEEYEILKSQFATSNAETPSLRSQFATLNNEENSLRSQIVTLKPDHISLRSQIATSNNRGGQRYLPYAFTENGIAMLSSVLRSSVAIETNIKIMRAFTAMRKVIATTMQVMQRLTKLEYHQIETDQKIDKVFQALEKGDDKPTNGLFYNGEIFDAYTFVCSLIKEAKKGIILIDNYVDETILTLLDKRTAGVTAKIYTKRITPQLQLDITRHNAQYAPIDIEIFADAHDRFLCIDDLVYHFGASLKDLGTKWFAFNKMEQTTDMLLSHIV